MRFVFFSFAIAITAAFALAGCPSPSPSPDDDGDAGDRDAYVAAILPYPDDAGTVEWDGWAGAFVRDYCVECHNPSAPCGGSGCHSAGDSALFDLDDRAAFVAHAPRIRCGIAVTQDPSWNCASPTEEFPLESGGNPLPTDEQRTIVVGWIDAGCP